MQTGTIAIVLIASVAHAVWNLASKYKRGDTVVFVWLYTAASALVLVPVGAILVATGEQKFTWMLLVGVVVSAAFHLAYSLTLQAGYDRAELSVVYPVARGSGPILTMLIATLLLGERLTPLGIIGGLVVILGVLVVAGNPLGNGQRSPLSGVIWGVCTGAAIASYTLWDSYSITELELTPVAYYAGTLLAQTIILAPGVFRRRALLGTSLRADAAPIAIVAVLSPLAYILVLFAMQTSPVALVAPLRESSIVIGSLLATRLFQEGHLARRLTGAVVVMVGIVAISLD